MSQNESKRIVVFIPNWVGDAVMATPALRALRAAKPDAEITFIGRPAPLAVLAGANLANATIADTSRTLGGLLAMAQRIRRKEFGLAILMPNSFRSALIAWMGRCSKRLGYARDGRSWLLTDRRKPPRDERGKRKVYPAIDYYADLVAALGIEVSYRQLSLAVTDAGELQAAMALQEAGCARGQRLVMLNPGGAFGPSKRWPIKRYAELADRLITECGGGIVINAAPNEKGVARDVAAAMTQKPALNLGEVDNTIDLLKSMIARCKLLVTNDTGARHIGAALGAGVVTIFSSTDPAWTPIGYDRERQVVTTADCAPCQRKRCPHLPGPTFGKCLTSITVDEVFAAAKELLPANDGGDA